MVPTFDVKQVSDPEHRAILAMLTNSKLSPTELSKRVHVSRSKLYRIAEKYLGPEFMSERDQSIKLENIKSAAQAGVHVCDDVIKIDDLVSEIAEPVGSLDATLPDSESDTARPAASVSPKQVKFYYGSRNRKIKKDIDNLVKVMQDLFRMGDYPSLSALEIGPITFSRNKIHYLRKRIFINARANELPECTSPYFPGVGFNQFISDYEEISERRYGKKRSTCTEVTQVNRPKNVGPIALPAPTKEVTENIPSDVLAEASISVRGVELTLRCASGDIGDCITKVLDKLKEF